MAIYNNRLCRSCGAIFSGGPRAWYCPNCREERKRATDRELKRNGSVRKIGNIDICQNCGQKYIIKSGLQKFCPDCQELMHKKIDREQSLRYYHEIVDKKERRIKRRINYANNRIKFRLSKQKYYEINRTKINEQNKVSRSKNKEFYNASQNIKRRLKRSKWRKPL